MVDLADQYRALAWVPSGAYIATIRSTSRLSQAAFQASTRLLMPRVWHSVGAVATPDVSTAVRGAS